MSQERRTAEPARSARRPWPGYKGGTLSGRRQTAPARVCGRGDQPPRSCSRQPLQAETRDGRSKPTPENRGRLSFIVLDRAVLQPSAAVGLANSCEDFAVCCADFNGCRCSLNLSFNGHWLYRFIHLSLIYLD